MKKNFKINMCGHLFSIDEDAYEMLSTYERSLRHYYRNREGGEEIADDLEGRIAEILEELKTDGVEAISIEHVQEVISRLGNPQQMEDGQTGADASDAGRNPDQDFRQAQAQAAETAQAFQQAMGQEGTSAKRLYRDPQNRKFMGVLAGFAAYFGGDVLWWRVGYVAIFILTGFAHNLTGLYLIRPTMFNISVLLVISYLVMAVLMPVASTPEERLRMKGRAVNPQNLAEEVSGEPGYARPRSQGRRDEHLGCIGGFVMLLSFLLKGFLFLLGASLVLLGLGALFFLLAVLIVPGQVDLHGIGLPDVFTTLLPARGLELAAILSAVATLFILVFSLVYGLLRLLGMKAVMGRWLALLLIFLSLLGIVTTGALAFSVVAKVAVLEDKARHDPDARADLSMLTDSAHYDMDTVFVEPDHFMGKGWLFQNKGPGYLHVDSVLASDSCVELTYPDTHSVPVGRNDYFNVRGMLHPAEDAEGPFSYEIKIWGNFPDSPKVLTMEGVYAKKESN